MLACGKVFYVRMESTSEKGEYVHKQCNTLSMYPQINFDISQRSICVYFNLQFPLLGLGRVKPGHCHGLF